MYARCMSVDWAAVQGGATVALALIAGVTLTIVLVDRRRVSTVRIVDDTSPLSARHPSSVKREISRLNERVGRTEGLLSEIDRLSSRVAELSLFQRAVGQTDHELRVVSNDGGLTWEHEGPNVVPVQSERVSSFEVKRSEILADPPRLSDFEHIDIWSSFTVPETNIPETTVPETNIPETTVPMTTIADCVLDQDEILRILGDD